MLGAVIGPPSKAQHWIKAKSRVGAAAVWRRHPARDVSIMIMPSGTSLLEKERNRIAGPPPEFDVLFPLLGSVIRQSLLTGEGLGKTNVTQVTKPVRRSQRTEDQRAK